MSPPIQPTPAPNVELELAKLANDAMANGADPHTATGQLHDMIAHLRANPQLAAQATNALADGIATPADISRTLAEHMRANPPESADTWAEQNVQRPDKWNQRIIYGLQTIPGVKAVQTALLAKRLNLPADKARALLAQSTGDLGEGEKLASRAVGSIPLMLTPGGPATAGALIGGSDQAMDPRDESLKARAVRTAIGMGLGAGFGRYFDVLGNQARAAVSPRFEDLHADLTGEAAIKNDGNYAAAKAAAAGRKVTPAVQALMNNPDYVAVAQDLSKSPRFRNMAWEDPEFINEAYKSLSDEQGAVGKGLTPLNPTRPNTKRNQLKDIDLLKEQILTALDTPGTSAPLTFTVPAQTTTVAPQVTPGHGPARGPMMPGTANQYADNTTSYDQIVRDFPDQNPGRQGPAGPSFALRAQPTKVTPGISISTPAMTVQTAPGQPLPAYMPEYRQAVDEAHKANNELDALQQGYESFPVMTAKGQPSTRQALNLSLRANKDFVAAPKRTLAERARLVQGILSSAKIQPGVSKNPFTGFTSRQARMLPGILDQLAAPGQNDASDLATKLGLAAFTSPFAP